MIKAGTDIHLQDPRFEERTLRAGSVVSDDDDHVIGGFEAEAVPAEAGDTLLLYYEENRHFVQQAVEVLEVVEREPSLLLALGPLGDPVLAESRQRYRVTTVNAGVTACIGEEDDRPVLDVSVTGFSALLEERHAPGTVLPVMLRHGEEAYVGRAIVVDLRDHEGGLKYGMRPVETDTEDGRDLERGLTEINLAVQRAQLRRT